MSTIPASNERLDRARSAVLIVDMQSRILAHIPRQRRIVWNVRRLAEAAGLFDVPVSLTEQYPERLGGTTPELGEGLPDALGKRCFTCLERTELAERWRDEGRFQVVVAGIETHVCVLQTVLDLLGEGFQTHVVVDAVASRAAIDHETAVRRLEGSGATPTTTEAALFEWCGDSRDPRFKSLSALIRQDGPAEEA